MTVLLQEPDDFLQVMFDVVARRAELQIYGPDSKRWDE